MFNILLWSLINFLVFYFKSVWFYLHFRVEYYKWTDVTENTLWAILFLTFIPNEYCHRKRETYASVQSEVITKTWKNKAINWSLWYIKNHHFHVGHLNIFLEFIELTNQSMLYGNLVFNFQENKIFARIYWKCYL